MKRQQLIEDIAYIKSVINSSLHYTNLSGIAAVISGIAALFGASFSLIMFEETDFYAMEKMIDFIIVWILVFFISVFAHIYFINRKARKNGELAWSRLSRLIVYALSPSLILGFFMTIFFLQKNQFSYIPPLWMISYGLGVWSAGLFSIPEPRWLGASFMVTGLFTLFFLLDYNFIMLAISFGGYHIVYGLRLIFRYGEG